MMELSGRTALVTGAGAGIGEAIARRLAREGASVVVADIDHEAARRVAGEIAGAGGTASPVRADVTRDADAAAIVDHTREEFGGLDILFNNAGGYERPVFPDAPVEHWTRTLDLNLRGVMLATHHALGAMMDRGARAIVNVASTAGLGLDPHPAPEYAAAKAAVIRLTACLAPLRERGVRVNCVVPYTVATPAVRATIADLTAHGRELPLPLRGVLLEPEDVADAVVALLMDDSAAGRVVVLRGGGPPELLAEDSATRASHPGGRPSG